jgi:hypothetical protein
MSNASALVANPNPLRLSRSTPLADPFIVSLTNVSSNYLSFQVESNPDVFRRISPICGFLEPNEACSLTLALENQDRDSTVLQYVIRYGMAPIGRPEVVSDYPFALVAEIKFASHAEEAMAKMRSRLKPASRFEISMKPDAAFVRAEQSQRLDSLISEKDHRRDQLQTRLHELQAELAEQEELVKRIEEMPVINVGFVGIVLLIFLISLLRSRWRK